MKLILISLLLVLLLLCFVCSPAADCIDRTPAPTFDLDRFLGHWYEIARFDHRFERGLEAVETDYALRSDGRIAVEHRGTHERTGRRRRSRGNVRTTRTPGHLRISLRRLFTSDYNVLEIADDYGWMIIGSRSPRFLWILARTPRLDVESTNRILQLARRRGYATSRLLFVDQPAADRTKVAANRTAVAANQTEVAAAEPAVPAKRPQSAAHPTPIQPPARTRTPAPVFAQPPAPIQATEQAMPSASTRAAICCSSSRGTRSSVGQGVSRSSE